MRRPLLGLAVLLLLSPLAQGQGNEKSNSGEVYPMPDFKVTSLDGLEIDTTKLHGRVVLLDIWATWCGPCIASAPALDKMFDELKGRGLEMFGVAVQSGDAKEVREAARKIGITYPVILWNKELAEKIQGIQSVPTYILINKEWNVEKLFVGATPPALIRRHVERLLPSEPAAQGGAEQ